MAKSAGFVFAVLLLFTVSFAARPLVDEDAVAEAELAVAQAPLVAWGPVYVPFIPGLEGGPDALIPAQAPYGEDSWGPDPFEVRLEEQVL